MDFNVMMVAVGDPMTVLALFNQSISSSDQRSSKTAAEMIVKYAQSYAPVGETGYLRDSIHTFRSGGGTLGKGASNYGVTVDAPYGIFVEYGTRKMQAQPFLRPAIEKANLPNIFADAIWNDPELKTAMHTPVFRMLSGGMGLGSSLGVGSGSLSPGAMAAGSFTGKFGFTATSSQRWVPW